MLKSLKKNNTISVNQEKEDIMEAIAANEIIGSTVLNAGKR